MLLFLASSVCLYVLGEHICYWVQWYISEIDYTATRNDAADHMVLWLIPFLAVLMINVLNTPKKFVWTYWIALLSAVVTWLLSVKALPGF